MRRWQRGRLCRPPLLPPPRLPAARHLLCVSCDPGIMSVGTGPAPVPCALPRPRALTKARAGPGGSKGSEKWLPLRLLAGRLAGLGRLLCAPACPTLAPPLEAHCGAASAKSRTSRQGCPPAHRSHLSSPLPERLAPLAAAWGCPVLAGMHGVHKH